MGENRYFQKALADFAHEAAYGGAVRHLADRGYTVKQITDRLDFPAPYEKVRQAVWEHLTDTGVILLEEPGSGRQKEKASYVKEYDKHGKPTFRRVPCPRQETEPVFWTETLLEPGKNAWAAALPALLTAKLAENGEAFSYAACDFGPVAAKEPDRYERMLQALGDEREYVERLPWERRRVYHRLDLRMEKILVALVRAGWYQGEIFFIKTGDKIKIGEE